MKTDTRLSASLAENLLILLCFDDSNAKMIRAAVTPQMFESAVFREFAGVAVDFIDQYGVAVKEHLPDHLDHILSGDDQRKAKAYRMLLDQLFMNRESINPEFVVSQLHAFVRQQTLKSGVIEAIEALDGGEVERAELAIQTALKKQVVSFEPGTMLSDPKVIIGMLGDLEEPGFDLGIKELDMAGIIPRRKELLLFIAPRGRGKSWFCTHVAKRARMARWSTAVITLEMSERRYTGRIIQSLFAVSKRRAEVELPRIKLAKSGEIIGFEQEDVDVLTLSKDRDVETLSSKIATEFSRGRPIVVKQFPTQMLTIEMLEAWLEGLDRHARLAPDVLIVDYPDLMKHDAKNKRIELGQLFERLRGLAVERNMALICVTQGNRESERAEVVTGDMAAEDISKLATADTCLTYSQTRQEKQLGLARILAEKARNESDKFSVLITQAYEIGQFCLDSHIMQADYWEVVEKKDGRND